MNDRIIMCKLKAKPFDIAIIQVYAPTADHPEEEIETFYEDLEKVMKRTKSGDIVIVMGDFNAKVGNTAMSKCMGKHGLGDTNERGERLTEFCKTHEMSIANTLFRQPKRRLYKWKSPGDLYRNQFDYIITKSRFKNNITRCNLNKVLASINHRGVQRAHVHRASTPCHVLTEPSPPSQACKTPVHACHLTSTCLDSTS